MLRWSALRGSTRDRRRDRRAPRGGAGAAARSRSAQFRPAAGAADVRRQAATSPLEAISSAGRLGGERLPVRAAAGVAAAQSRLLKAPGARRPRRLRRGRRRRRSRTSCAIQDEDIWVRAAHSVDAGAHSRPEDDGRARRRAGRARRVPPLQGHQRASDACARSQPDLTLPPEKSAAAADPGGEPVLHVSEPALQPGARGQDRERRADRARAEREAAGARSIASYRLLGLIYPWKDIAAARWSLAARRRARSRRARPVSRQHRSTPASAQARDAGARGPADRGEGRARGNVLLKTRVRDAEDSLAQLVHDEDQIVAAAAIQFVEQRGLWNLADDLEYALEHRDAQGLVRVRGGVVGAGRARRMTAERAPAALARAAAGGGSAPTGCDGCRSSSSPRSTSCSASPAPGGRCGTSRAATIYEAGRRATGPASSCSTAPSRASVTTTGRGTQRSTGAGGARLRRGVSKACRSGRR